jgi:hypothetical protein
MIYLEKKLIKISGLKMRVVWKIWEKWIQIIALKKNNYINHPINNLQTKNNLN